jgi:hypothetical protein
VAGRLLAPGGGTVQHFDRFVMPCVAEVEYRLGDKSHLLVATALTPVDDHHTRLFAVVAFRLPLPTWLVQLVAKPVARRIFAQDARMLARQTQTIHQFGGEQYVSTELDTVGPAIRRMLAEHERGAVVPMEAPEERRLEMEV